MGEYGYSSEEKKVLYEYVFILFVCSFIFMENFTATPCILYLTAYFGCVHFMFPFCHCFQYFQDERCSFSVQMWNFHLRATRHDMWHILPPSLSQNLFSAIVRDSLLMLMQRYARVKPSFRRVKQYKCVKVLSNSISCKMSKNFS